MATQSRGHGTPIRALISAQLLSRNGESSEPERAYGGRVWYTGESSDREKAKKVAEHAEIEAALQAEAKSACAILP